MLSDSLPTSRDWCPQQQWVLPLCFCITEAQPYLETKSNICHRYWFFCCLISEADGGFRGYIPAPCFLIPVLHISFPFNSLDEAPVSALILSRLFCVHSGDTPASSPSIGRWWAFFGGWVPGSATVSLSYLVLFCLFYKEIQTSFHSPINTLILSFCSDQISQYILEKAAF